MTDRRRRVVIRGGMDDGEEFWLDDPKPEHFWSVPVSMSTWHDDMGFALRNHGLVRHVLTGEDENGKLLYEPRP